MPVSIILFWFAAQLRGFPALGLVSIVAIICLSVVAIVYLALRGASPKDVPGILRALAAMIWPPRKR